MAGSSYIKVSIQPDGLVHVRYCGLASIDVWQAYLDACVGITKRGLHATLHDVREIGRLTARHRRLITDWYKEHDPIIRRYEVACGMVLATRWQRAIVKGIQWVSPIPIPLQFYVGADEGEKWLHKELNAARQTWPIDRQFGPSRSPEEKGEVIELEFP